MSDPDSFVTIVIPVFRSAGTLGELARRLSVQMEILGQPWELLFVVDGESDTAWQQYREEIPLDLPVRMVRLSRNFGQHPAIRYGIQEAQPGAVVVMDCDLQDPPEIVPKVLGPILAGKADMVLTQRRGKFDENSRVLMRSAYSRFLSAITGLEIHAGLGPFIGLSDNARQYVNAFSEDAHLLHVLRWLALPEATVGYERNTRPQGKSSYSLMRTLRHALRGLAFSANRLMGALFTTSFVVALLSIFGLLTLGIKFAQGTPPSGWLSLISVMTLGFALMGMLLSIVGGLLLEVLGLVRGRPPVVIADHWSSRSV